MSNNCLLLYAIDVLWLADNQYHFEKINDMASKVLVFIFFSLTTRRHIRYLHFPEDTLDICPLDVLTHCTIISSEECNNCFECLLLVGSCFWKTWIETVKLLWVSVKQRRRFFHLFSSYQVFGCWLWIRCGDGHWGREGKNVNILSVRTPCSAGWHSK